jgi:hypothetical protein
MATARAAEEVEKRKSDGSGKGGFFKDPATALDALPQVSAKVATDAAGARALPRAFSL